MMRNIFHDKGYRQKLFEKNIVFFTFCIHIFLIFAYSIRLHRKTVNKETRDIYYKPNK